MTAVKEPAARVGRLAFRFAVIGTVLGLIGPALDAIGGVTVDRGGSILIAVGIVVQAASVALILAGVIAGIMALVRGVRPRTLPVLAIVALPVSGLLILIEVFIIFLVTT
jgi:hypothetical protein